MRIQEVPQDKKQFKNEEVELRKILYVTNDKGEYTQTPSYGWETENLALEQVWEELTESIEKERLNVINGVSSPIAYYMLKNRMDIAVLASYVGKWQWQVKRHMKPDIFKSLSEKTLSKYAEVFNISTTELLGKPLS